jgi:ribose-phosphate pyrophosphokinase
MSGFDRMVIPVMQDIRLFALDAGADFGARVAEQLGIALSEHEERAFEDGEHKARPLVNVRGRDVFVVQSLYSDADQSANDKLCKLLFFIGALRDASAARVTAVVPYLCYARKDRKTQTRDPVTTRYVATLFEAIGVDRMLSMDVHNLAAFQNAFRCPTDHLEARPLFARYFAKTLGDEPVVILSPDVGGMKRAEAFRQTLASVLGRDLELGFMEKRRALGKVSGETLFAQVENKAVVIIDDLISTGTTMGRAARACLDQGATGVYAAATHGLFIGGANEVLAAPSLSKTVVTDTIPPFRLEPGVVAQKLEVLSAAPLFAGAIKAIHSGGSIVELLGG